MICVTDRGDGTYSQIDPTHAHLNMPATLMWASGFEKRRVCVTISTFPAFFDASAYEINQHFATSKDGTTLKVLEVQRDALDKPVFRNHYANTTAGGVPIFPGPLTSITDANDNVVVYRRQAAR